MKKSLLLLFALVATLTAVGQPTSVPSPAGDDQLILYSNGGQNGFWFDAWGGGAGLEETIGEQKVYKIANFNYFGSQLYSNLDVSNKKYFHIDVYPLQDMTLAFVMINKNEAGNGKDGEKGIQKSLTGNEWNSIDIEVQDYLDKGAAMSRLYQIKFVSTVVANGEGIAGSDGFGNGNGTDAFYVGNLYFYGTRVTDTEPPVLVTAEASEIGGNSVTLKLNATDNNDNVTFMINDAANSKSYETSGTSGIDVMYTIYQLNANTEYSFEVQAKDIAGNLSNQMTVTFTTADGFSLTAAPTPDKDAANVQSIFSDAYTAATIFNFGWWDQSTQMETVTVDGDNILKLTNFNYLGFEYATDLDLSEMDYLHIDILPMQAMNFGITPIMRGGKTEDSQDVGTLNVEQWNSIDIPLSQFGFDLSYGSFQLKLDRGTGSETVYVDNIYFWKSGGTDPQPEEPASGEGEYVIESGMNAGKTLKYTYAFTQEGMDVTVTFANVSTDEIIGLTDGYVHDLSNGFAEHAGLSFTWENCTVGQELKAAHKWEFAEGAFTTDAYSYKVKEAEVTEITAITVVADENEVQVGKTLQLSVKDQDDNVVAAPQVTFVSSDDAIATVDENGVVTGVAEGDVMITVTLKDNTEISGTLAIVVTAAASDALTAGEADENGLVKLTGTWSDDEFAAIDAVKQANSYDLTEVVHEGTLDVIGKTANPYCIFVTPVAGTVNRNEAVATDGGYNGYAMFFQEGVNAEAPFDINTAIQPISVGNPFFQRLFDRAGYYVTMTVPFDYDKIPEASNGTKFYELNASTNGETVTLNFTEVSSIVANKPYLVYSGTGGITIPDPGQVTINWDAQTETADGASFVANYKALQPLSSENVYVVPAGIREEAKVSFVKSANATIRPFRAYLTLSSATKINITFGDEEATAIRGISDDVLNALFDVYSIDGKKVKSAGQKMFDLPAGLYIINGKKVVMK